MHLSLSHLSVVQNPNMSCMSDLNPFMVILLSLPHSCLLTGTHKRSSSWHLCIGSLLFSNCIIHLLYSIIINLQSPQRFRSTSPRWFIPAVRTTRLLRSTDRSLSVVFPRWRPEHRRDGAFAVVVPRIWNKLSPQIRLDPTLSIFKSKLKTHFYSLSFLEHTTSHSRQSVLLLCF